MRIVYLLLIGCCLVACKKSANPKVDVPAEVFVSHVEERPYHPSTTFNARIESKNDVNITAQISGELVAIHFKEGDQIDKGDPLYDIAPKPYQTALARQQAELAKAEANEKITRKNFERGKALVKDGFISASEFDSLEAKALEAAAQKQAAQAAVESAQVDLGYTTIFAPNAGKIGHSIPTLGDIVSPQLGSLTTLVGKGAMEVVFQIPERLLLSARSNNIKPDDITVIITLPDGAEYSESGVINFLSNRVDATTGTAEVRASVENPNEILRPGMFVRAKLELKQPLSALMLPQAAVQVDQQGAYVFTVDESSTVIRKNIQTSERIQEYVVAIAGVEASEKVIVRGIQKVRPGVRVTPLDFNAGAQVTGD